MKHKGIVIKVGLVAIIIILLIFIVIKYNLIKEINFESINESVKQFINSFGKFAAFIFILIFSLRTLLIFVPSSIMVIIGGSMFGSVKGFIFSMISVFISSSIAFFISRYAGKDFVNKILKGKMKVLDTKAEEHGFKLIFLMRLSVIFPFDIMNYAAGLSKIRYFDFILGTMLGIMPEIFSINYVASNMGNPMSLKFKIAIVIFILTVALPFFLSRRKKNKGSSQIKIDNV